MSLVRYAVRSSQFCLLLFMVACSKEDNTPKLAGTWKLQYTETDQYHTNGTLANASGLQSPNPVQTFVFTDTDVTISPASTVGVSNQYSYTYQGDKLTISFPDGNGQLHPQEYTVLEFTKPNLKLQIRSDDRQGSYILNRYHFARK